MVLATIDGGRGSGLWSYAKACARLAPCPLAGAGMTFAGGEGHAVDTHEPQTTNMTPPDRDFESPARSGAAVRDTVAAVPAAADPGASHGDWGLLVLRVFAGLALALAHGIGKIPPSAGFVEGVAGMGFPAPLAFAWAAGLAESAGGLLLALGLFTRPAAFFILVNMLVASFLMQAGDPFLERELALLYAFVALFYMLAGPGRLSVDRLRAGRSSARGALLAS